ncbi:hypothetical protein HGRIS_000250 [Hohenbuehelia grisea]|uniref:RNA methyltransferase n=1 Tax=Hohenbuehelia grisea TaxID=104357 RepID=A0ABR3JRE1_9AGAR
MKRKRSSSNITPPLRGIPRPGYFPAAFEHMLGPLPIPSASQELKHVFPHNIAFRTADWASHPILEDGEGYDVVVAFSITKWIHLNGGDDSIRGFFRRIHEVLKPQGHLILEPQAWNTYAKAKRMDEHLKQIYQSLSLRPEHFESILEEMGFEPPQHLGTTGDGGFQRPVDLYKKL